MTYPWVVPLLARLPAKPSALPEALMLRGQPGLGKRETALYLAGAILCESVRVSIQPCGACPSCHLLAAGNHPDLRLIEVESDDAEPATPVEEETSQPRKASRQITVDKVRSLADFVGVTAHRGKAKVIVICPAEAMHPSAANAVLKMLEEPPADTHFMLVSHQPDRVLPTVRSRCFDMTFTSPQWDTATAWLRENGAGEPDMALALAGHAPLEALNRSRDTAFWTRRRGLLDLLAQTELDPLLAADRAEPMEGPEVARLLAQWAYDLIALKTGLSARYHIDHLSSLQRLAGEMEVSSLFKWYDAVLQYGRASQHPLNKRLAMESLFSGYPVAS